ncbi:hypothetical protein GCM10023172_25680 [Hymenobacter ginsengisoli]|uniref:Uncharacterized protein n=1 Tax=Hymenobacter ginsengisoli TaxID=1051626 RepID=A0ABP8QH42_9BACT|nr:MULTISPECIES: hypothetical protein [unclassified Hymenobacter]MBO2030173.1 hypothetical protein [Hymenobacter sp. BT559]
MKVVAQTDFNLGTKILIYSCVVGFGLLVTWDAIDVPQRKDFERKDFERKDFGHLYFISLPLLLGCITGFFYLIRHRLVLTETCLWQYGFRAKSILLEDIESITEYMGSYLIKDDKTSIRITTDLRHKDTFKNQVIQQFQQLDKARHRIPGQELATEYANKLVQQIRHMVDKGLQSESLIKIAPSLLEQLVEPTYYVVYEHPTHEFLHRAYNTKLSLLKSFTQQYSEDITTSKTDAWILSQSLEWFILCSTDGMFFYANN